MIKPNYVVIPTFAILVSVIGSGLTSQSLQGWYQQINLPEWTPPGSVIGIVWTILFILAAISALMVWNKTVHDRQFRNIITAFVINGVLNVLWSFLFFSRHLVGLAAIEAVVLGLSVVLLIVWIWSRSRLAASLLVPYAAWVFFASFLTYSVWVLNK
jgi:tryptophan-rich sensory protein